MSKAFRQNMLQLHLSSEHNSGEVIGESSKFKSFSLPTVRYFNRFVELLGRNTYRSYVYT